MPGKKPKRSYVEMASVSDAPEELMAETSAVISEEVSVGHKLTRPKKPEKIASGGIICDGYVDLSEMLEDVPCEPPIIPGRHFVFFLSTTDGIPTQCVVNKKPWTGEPIENPGVFKGKMKAEGFEMKRCGIGHEFIPSLAMEIVGCSPSSKEIVQDAPAVEEKKTEVNDEFPFAREIDRTYNHNRAINSGRVKTWLEKAADSVWTQSQVYCEDGTCYDVEKLIEETENNKKSRVKIEEIANQLDTNAWGDDKKFISPLSVIKNPVLNADYKIHMRRIQTADMDKPILIRFRDGKVIDGYHRLARAYMSHDRYIDVIFIQDEQFIKSEINS
jgi:hypothetical protein